MAKETEKVDILTCWYCKEVEVSEQKKLDNKRFFHDECKIKFDEKKRERLAEYVRLKVGIMHERALRLMEQQGLLLENYFDESGAVLEKAFEEPSKFASAPEMMVAMELLRNETRFKPEFKVGSRRVDFLIPELKVALEIDGHLHQYKPVKDSYRDNEILHELNKEEIGWEVIRIPTERVEQNLTKLLPAIKSLYNYRQSLRRENGGLLPHGNNVRQDEHYQKIINM